MTSQVDVVGTGVHSGVQATVRLFRRPGPVRFRRGGRELGPSADRVVATRGCTVLGGDGVRIAVVEHLLAALHVRGIWSDLLVEVTGDELPILDGSATGWDEALAELGTFPTPPEPRLGRGETAHAGPAWAALDEGAPSLEVEIEFSHPSIGRQHWSGTPERWRDLLPARTFGFAADAAALRAAGLALGASVDNAIVFDDDGPMAPLRFPDEPVRHKALDALGDLYLLGRPFAGRLRVHRGGHDLHWRLVTRLLDGAAGNRRA